MQMDHVFWWRDKESTDSIHNNENIVEQKVYDKYGFDQYGFDEEGFDLHGLNRWEFDEYGDDARFPFRDKDGFDRDGYEYDAESRLQTFSFQAGSPTRITEFSELTTIHMLKTERNRLPARKLTEPSDSPDRQIRRPIRA